MAKRESSLFCTNATGPSLSRGRRAGGVTHPWNPRGHWIDSFRAVAVWLAAPAASRSAARAFYALSRGRYALAQLPLDAERVAAVDVCRRRQLCSAHRRSDLLAIADQ